MADILNFPSRRPPRAPSAKSSERRSVRVEIILDDDGDPEQLIVTGHPLSTGPARRTISALLMRTSLLTQWAEHARQPSDDTVVGVVLLRAGGVVHALSATSCPIWRRVFSESVRRAPQLFGLSRLPWYVLARWRRVKPPGPFTLSR